MRSCVALQSGCRLAMHALGHYMLRSLHALPCCLAIGIWTSEILFAGWSVASPAQLTACVPACSFLLVSITMGCEPSNQLWYLDLRRLPTKGDNGGLDFSQHDKQKGESAKALPLEKLIDKFEAAWEVLANKGTKFTLMTNWDAPRYRCASHHHALRCWCQRSRYLQLLSKPADHAMAHKIRMPYKACSLSPLISLPAVHLAESHIIALYPAAHLLCCPRIVRGDIAANRSPKDYEDLIPQHDTHLLQWACAMKVGFRALHTCQAAAAMPWCHPLKGWAHPAFSSIAGW